MSTLISENIHVRNALDAVLAPDLADHVLQLVDAAASRTDATAQVVILRGAPDIDKTHVLRRIEQAFIPRYVARAENSLTAEARAQVQYVHAPRFTVAALRSNPDGKLLLLDDATPAQVNALADRRGGMVIALESTDGLSDEVLRRSRQFDLHPQPAVAA